jgi:uncharacterized protein (DUF2267 family)
MVEQNDNKAAVVNAVLALERLEPEQAAAAAAQTPGVVIQIIQAAPHEIQHPMRIIDNALKPLNGVADDD